MPVVIPAARLDTISIRVFQAGCLAATLAFLVVGVWRHDFIMALGFLACGWDFYFTYGIAGEMGDAADLHRAGRHAAWLWSLCWWQTIFAFMWRLNTPV